LGGGVAEGPPHGHAGVSGRRRTEPVFEQAVELDAACSAIGGHQCQGRGKTGLEAGGDPVYRSRELRPIIGSAQLLDAAMRAARLHLDELPARRQASQERIRCRQQCVPAPCRDLVAAGRCPSLHLQNRQRPIDPVLLIESALVTGAPVQKRRKIVLRETPLETLPADPELLQEGPTGSGRAGRSLYADQFSAMRGMEYDALPERDTLRIGDQMPRPAGIAPGPPDRVDGVGHGPDRRAYRRFGPALPVEPVRFPAGRCGGVGHDQQRPFGSSEALKSHALSAC
jgi:hypothetical protein